MNQTPFIWLGANRAHKWPVGEKGRLLDQAAHAGLPVPPGAILLDEFYRLALDAGVIASHDRLVVATDDEWLHETLYKGARFPAPDDRVAVRAAFSAAEAIPPRLNVNFLNAGEMAAALCAIWSQAGQADEVRRDVLVMEMVKKEVAGTAVTDSTIPLDVVTWGSAALQLPQLRLFDRPDPQAPPFARRLQMLLRGLRRTLGKGAWQVDWLDDGQICWIIQLHSRSRED